MQCALYSPSRHLRSMCSWRFRIVWVTFCECGNFTLTGCAHGDPWLHADMFDLTLSIWDRSKFSTGIYTVYGEQMWGRFINGFVLSSNSVVSVPFAQIKSRFQSLFPGIPAIQWLKCRSQFVNGPWSSICCSCWNHSSNMAPIFSWRVHIILYVSFVRLQSSLCQSTVWATKAGWQKFQRPALLESVPFLSSTLECFLLHWMCFTFFRVKADCRHCTRFLGYPHPSPSGAFRSHNHLKSSATRRALKDARSPSK